jgi:hypothetical protein
MEDMNTTEQNKALVFAARARAEILRHDDGDCVDNLTAYMLETMADALEQSGCVSGPAPYHRTSCACAMARGNARTCRKLSLSPGTVDGFLKCTCRCHDAEFGGAWHP